MKMDMERETKMERLEHRWALVSYLFFYSFLYGEKCLALESADKQLKFDSSLCNTATKHQVSINLKVCGIFSIFKSTKNNSIRQQGRLWLSWWDQLRTHQLYSINSHLSATNTVVSIAAFTRSA